MVGEPFNKRSVPCAFGIKIGLYFHNRTLILIQCVSKQVFGFLLQNYKIKNGLTNRNLRESQYEGQLKSNRLFITFGST